MTDAERRHYVDTRLATLTSAEPIVPVFPWDMGQRFELAGEEGPWRLIEFCGVFDNGADSGGYEMVVRPVSMEPGHDCSPRKVTADSVSEVGYVPVSTPSPSTDEWATDPATLAPPFGVTA